MVYIEEVQTKHTSKQPATVHGIFHGRLLFCNILYCKGRRAARRRRRRAARRRRRRAAVWMRTAAARHLVTPGLVFRLVAAVHPSLSELRKKNVCYN